MKKFNLAQLKYAQEVCFADTFVALFNKHAKETGLYDCGHVMLFDLKYKHDGLLLNWIFNWSRADMDGELGTIVEGILTDLIGNYKG